MSATCQVQDCGRPQYQGRPYCGSHFMKWYRHGDPLYKAPSRAVDLTGQRFGSLIPLHRIEGRASAWVCQCDCGRQTIALVGDLNRGSKATCGDERAHWSAPVTYSNAHSRVALVRGRAKDYACADCGQTAMHWSYDRLAPDEQQAAEGPWSADVAHYEPRCVPCHKRFDLAALKG